MASKDLANPKRIIAYLDEEEDRMINHLLLRSAGLSSQEIEERMDTNGLGFSVVDEEDDFILHDDEEVEGDEPLFNAADYISDAKERHRRILKLGEIPYQVAWMDGFTHSKGKKIYYKIGSRLRKAFEAGKRARNV